MCTLAYLIEIGVRIIRNCWTVCKLCCSFTWVAIVIVRSVKNTAGEWNHLCCHVSGPIGCVVVVHVIIYSTAFELKIIMKNVYQLMLIISHYLIFVYFNPFKLLSFENGMVQALIRNIPCRSVGMKGNTDILATISQSF